MPNKVNCEALGAVQGAQGHGKLTGVAVQSYKQPCKARIWHATPVRR